VFVNQDAQWINDIAQQLNLAAIQLHGDESPEVMTHFRDRTVIRCLRPSPQVSLETCLAQCQLWIDAGVQSILIDAPPPQRRGELELAEGETPDPYGGTGLTSNWQLAAQLREHLPVPLILAGGLNPSNVAEAINTVHPAAVDVASGVESFPGKKNSQQLESFISRAKQAFAIKQ
jgi:phosphoribosylanthranilate isomerase